MLKVTTANHGECMSEYSCKILVALHIHFWQAAMANVCIDIFYICRNI